MSLVIPDDGSDLVLTGVLPFLFPPFQDASPPDYEVIVVTSPSRRTVFDRTLAALGFGSGVALVSAPADWRAAGVAAARGEYVGLFGDPGVPSPALVSTLLVAIDAHPEPWLVVRTFAIPCDDSVSDWLAANRFPDDCGALVRRATLSFAGEPPYRFLDPSNESDNVVASRHILQELIGNARESKRPLLKPPPDATRIQIVGSGMVRPAPNSQVEGSIDRSVDASLRFFGRLTEDAPSPCAPRPRAFRRLETPKLSVIVVVHDMVREAPRTLQTLRSEYQRGVAGNDYEVLVVDNGSTPPLGEDAVRAIVPEARYVFIADAPPSPARAINRAVSLSRGDALAIMIDGACLCTPGVLASGLAAFRSFPRPVVSTRYFFLGPGRQVETVAEGYDQSAEDELLAGIGFPSEGYRLFEVSSPITYGSPHENWLTPWFESNCLFMPRSVFNDIGGYDESFDLPGGGALNIDVFVRACSLPTTQPVQLIGEGVFHQVHGGITTNTTASEHDAKRARYTEQYVALRGPVPDKFPKSFFFMGHLPIAAARRKMLG